MVAGAQTGWAQAKPEGAVASGTTTTVPVVAKRPRPSEAQIDDMLNDWANLKRFGAKNAALAPPAAGVRRVVFMGDSITEGWTNYGVPLAKTDAGYSADIEYVNRGISGQTTPQMLVRFRPDVIDLKPSVVVILAGINDVAGNTGEMTLEQTEENYASMSDLAHANGIQVVLCSVLPAYDFPWSPGRQPAPKVVALNRWLKDYAATHGYVYVDYYSAMVDQRGGLPANLSHDGVHPTKAGYDIMNPLAQAGVAKALAAKPVAGQ
jgi:lysophospholipase L1-like esterase